MKKMKVLLVFTLVVSMLFGMGIAANAATNVKIVLDGKTLTSDQEPRFENNFTLVPIRVISEALGGEVGYNSAAKKVTITTSDHMIELAQDSKSATVDGKTVSMDVPMRNFGGRTFVPARFISENIGAQVEYLSASKTVSITYFSNMSGKLTLSGSTTIQPFADAIAKTLMDKNSSKLSVTVTGGGSGVGIKDAEAGTVNIGNSSAALSASEKSANPDLVQTQIGSDAIAMIVNKKNPVKTLTKEEVYKIFTGKIVNWKDVGGNNAPILVQVREATSGTAKSFFDLAVKKFDSKAVIPTSFTPSISSGTLMQAVAANENAIGYDSFGYINDTVKPLAVEDIDCTFNNAFSGVWPYTRALVMLTKGAPSDLTAKYINFARSTEGQKAMTDMDYIPLRDTYIKKAQ